MNISNSECSSGCESGWTMYLDQTSNFTGDNNPYSNRDFSTSRYYKGAEYVNQDDEDLSMVSDASSGPPPPHYYTTYYDQEDGDSKRKSKQKKCKSKETSTKVHKLQQNLCLDDTASSPIYHFPVHQDNVAPDNQYVPGLSQVESESIKKKNFAFFKSAIKGKSSGNLLGRKRQ